MANLTPEQLETALAAIIDGVTGAGPVITDTRFSQGDKEFARLLTSQNPDRKPQGWIVAWVGLTNQIDDSTCEVVVPYQFRLAFLYPYLNDSAGDQTSEEIFLGLIFAVNEALNQARDLALDNRVRHTCLQSAADFDVVDWGESAANVITHLATFNFAVEVTNRY